VRSHDLFHMEYSIADAGSSLHFSFPPKLADANYERMQNWGIPIERHENRVTLLPAVGAVSAGVWQADFDTTWVKFYNEDEAKDFGDFFQSARGNKSKIPIKGYDEHLNHYFPEAGLIHVNHSLDKRERITQEIYKYTYQLLILHHVLIEGTGVLPFELIKIIMQLSLSANRNIDYMLHLLSLDKDYSLFPQTHFSKDKNPCKKINLKIERDHKFFYLIFDNSIEAKNIYKEIQNPHLPFFFNQIVVKKKQKFMKKWKIREHYNFDYEKTMKRPGEIRIYFDKAVTMDDFLDNIQIASFDPVIKFIEQGNVVSENDPYFSHHISLKQSFFKLRACQIIWTLPTLQYQLKYKTIQVLNKLTDEDHKHEMTNFNFVEFSFIHPDADNKIHNPEIEIAPVADIVLKHRKKSQPLLLVPVNNFNTNLKHYEDILKNYTVFCIGPIKLKNGLLPDFGGLFVATNASMVIDNKIENIDIAFVAVPRPIINLCDRKYYLEQLTQTIMLAFYFASFQKNTIIFDKQHWYADKEDLSAIFTQVQNQFKNVPLIFAMQENDPPFQQPEFNEQVDVIIKNSINQDEKLDLHKVSNNLIKRCVVDELALEKIKKEIIKITDYLEKGWRTLFSKATDDNDSALWKMMVNNKKLCLGKLYECFKEGLYLGIDPTLIIPAWKQLTLSGMNGQTVDDVLHTNRDGQWVTNTKTLDMINELENFIRDEFRANVEKNHEKGYSLRI